MEKLNLQNIKIFFKSKKNLLIIFLIFTILILIFYSFLLRKVITSKDEVYDALLNAQKIINEDNVVDNEEGALKSYKIEDFSDDYKIDIEVLGYYEDRNTVEASRIVYDIYNKKLDELLMTVDTAKSKNANEYPAYFINFKINNDIVKVNENPCSEENNSSVFYQDFNFDGIKDFAFLTGRLSGYGSSSFDVYLATKDGFVYNEDFTQLTQGDQGMFDVQEDKLITKSREGASVYYHNEFIVKNNKPKQVLKVTRYEKPSEEGYYIEVTTEKLINGVWTKEVTTEPYEK